MEQGYIHLYTGNGKGKTTAAFGLALRALCAGKKIYVCQFVKSMKYHETKLVERFDNIDIEQFGRGCFIFKEAVPEDVDAAVRGVECCAQQLRSGRYDMVIMDELTIACYYKLLSQEAIIEALMNRHPAVEVVITGRYAPLWMIEMADLVTEMKEIKHYYNDGVAARDGIER